MKNESQLLHDPATGDWIVSAPRRRKKPDGVKHAHARDPFSRKEMERHERILATYGTGKNAIFVLANQFPTFDERRGLRGHQELLVEGERKRPFASFSEKEIAGVLHAYAARATAIRKIAGMKSLVTFKNEGREAGASQPHPHSQLFALSFVPDRWKEIDRRRRRAEQRHGATSHARALAEASSPHTVYADRAVIAFVHPAARFAYEARILTRRKIDNIAQATAGEVASLAKALHALLAFVRTRKLAYNFYFHDVFADTHEHFEIRFTPRMGVWGGFELDAGIAVNPVPAEQAAEEYQMAKKWR